MAFETLITTYDEKDCLICAAMAETADEPTQDDIEGFLYLLASDATWALVTVHAHNSGEILKGWKVEVHRGKET